MEEGASVLSPLDRLRSAIRHMGAGYQPQKRSIGLVRVQGQVEAIVVPAIDAWRLCCTLVYYI
jgi:hypothetical protein